MKQSSSNMLSSQTEREYTWHSKKYKYSLYSYRNRSVFESDSPATWYWRYINQFWWR